MNILIVLAVAAFALCLIWAAQSVALVLVGEPLAWPLRFTTQAPLVRWTSRIAIHTAWLVIIVGTPLALGMGPREALHQAFPMPVPWRDIAVAFAIALFPYALVYLFYVALGWVRVAPRHDRATRRGKLLRRFLGPLPLATLEEAVFRGVLLEQLLRALPPSPTDTVLAIVLSAIVFSAVHFIKRPYPGKPIWQPAYGLFIVGCLFGLAYVIGGRSLWLPIAVHAGGILVTEVARLYVVYQRPPWLLGYAEFPHCGLAGSLTVLVMAIALAVSI
jgi:hypothetical protein